MSSLLSQTRLLIHLLVFLSIKMDYPFIWRMLSLKICWLSWATWPFRAASHRSPHTSSMKKPKSAHMKSKVTTLLLAFFTPLEISISCVSWSWIQSTHQTQQLGSQIARTLLLTSRASRCGLLFWQLLFHGRVMFSTYGDGRDIQVPTWAFINYIQLLWILSKEDKWRRIRTSH